jgi:hypothetical protein
MSNIIPFGNGAALPAYLANKAALASINRDVVSASASFPVLSIKGKVFTLSKDGEKKVLMREDEPDEVMQNITLTVVRANTKSRVFYAKAYVEGESDGAVPSCFSNDGIAPSPEAQEPQSKKCQICARAVWGGKSGGVGTECSMNTRLAVADPSHIEDPFLLRVPPASRKAFAEAVKAAETRGIPYNALVMKVGFDKEAASPKLTFKLTGLLDDTTYAKAHASYENETVREIVGLAVHNEALELPALVDTDELDAAISAKAVVAKAAAPKVAPPKPAPKPAPAMDDFDVEDIAAKPAAKVAPAPKPAPKAATSTGMDDLLGDLDMLLGNSDD